MSWSDYDYNIYYYPEKSDLTLVAELNDAEASYSFEDLLVFKSKSGKLWYAQDSGCSCPTPFESFYFHGDDNNNLNPLNSRNFSEIESLANDWRASLDNKQKFLAKVKEEI